MSSDPSADGCAVRFHEPYSKNSANVSEAFAGRGGKARPSSLALAWTDYRPCSDTWRPILCRPASRTGRTVGIFDSLGFITERPHPLRGKAFLAGAAGIEPAVPVLETGGLPLTDAPMYCVWMLHQFLMQCKPNDRVFLPWDCRPAERGRHSHFAAPFARNYSEKKRRSQ